MRLRPVGHVASPVDAAARSVADDKKGPLPKRMLIDAGSPRLQLPGGAREGRRESSVKLKGRSHIRHLRTVYVRGARACSDTPGSRASSARFQVVDVFGISRQAAWSITYGLYAGWPFSAVHDWLNKAVGLWRLRAR